ncbi:RNHCP domain-containing protein [Candidatus Peregrinibacteria bacterium]|nr:RNHCP domain-containing protein [Candidatus Peregrinibacteria bacterium]
MPILSIMTQSRKNFITINSGFICEKCKKTNEKAKKTCRNHCRHCLFSKHVDENVPGDRKSNCNGLMVPIEIIDSPKGRQVKHQCIVCTKEQMNITADDDDIDAVIDIMQKQNLNSW